MASKAGASRWADTEEDAALDAKLKRQKEEKKRQKADKARRQEEERRAAELARQQQEASDDRPSKRRRLTPERDEDGLAERRLLKLRSGGWAPCRGVGRYEKLNEIEEGTYGYVSRAKEGATGRIVALKKLKIEPADRNGFPVTALREIKVLRNCEHRNIVQLLEIVSDQASKFPRSVPPSTLSPFPSTWKKKTLTPPSVYLVLEFVEHDLRSILEDMTDAFLPSEIKQLMLQLTSGVSYLHANYILHRDLKTSNLLLSNKGQLKIADFGMARHVGDPAPKLTTLVVTLWYRAPELLLGAKDYGPAIDMWSVGCVFAELLERTAIFKGSNEADQIARIFDGLGLPTEDSWPAFRRLPNAPALKLPRRTGPAEDRIRPRFPDLTAAGCALLRDLLSLNPEGRPSAAEVLNHAYFDEKPRPKAEGLFPTFPSKASQERRPRREPNAPVRGEAVGFGEGDFAGLFAGREGEAKGAGFRLRMG